MVIDEHKSPLCPSDSALKDLEPPTNRSLYDAYIVDNTSYSNGMGKTSVSPCSLRWRSVHCTVDGLTRQSLNSDFDRLFMTGSWEGLGLRTSCLVDGTLSNCLFKHRTPF